MVRDNDAVIKLICGDGGADMKKVPYIITRPGGLKEDTATGTVGISDKAASTMITYEDLAKVTLEALNNEKLYGTLPFIA
eukprot:CAMPEP_0118681340 /NCGR_PEP_ID=MMETSP0800-20121206/4882_1 /TAXON_ID=210618 ORGANISM="Striatella unipunctata, Strain CCMP2910" /NCGR_SAMPLE_ID=MMETSP0800 /ASSEMBLY_ACC=CAM_ASM_000638 /LENGTH=79 /DNA_ID=CAMNT_0006577621 /DNA_START=117 /DNA_END=356 /DNA_ORIENTATION=+